MSSRNENATCSNCPNYFSETGVCRLEPVVTNKFPEEWCSNHPDFYSVDKRLLKAMELLKDMEFLVKKYGEELSTATYYPEFCGSWKQEYGDLKRNVEREVMILARERGELEDE